MDGRPLLLAIGGPTASGKTDLAIDLALRLDGEIVNADSRQIYRGMEIGTAKPTPAQRATVPHHLLDLALPSEQFTLAQYTQRAHATIREIQGRGTLPLLVGGTGLYLRAVVQGYVVPEAPPNLDLRRDLEREAAAHGPAALVERLRAVDPVAAARIDGRNLRRVIRALEVSLSLGVPFSSLQRREAPYRTLTIVLHGNRTLLYTRADARLQAMLDAGFEAEVARLLDAGYDPALPAMSALGYRELAAALRGEITRAAAIEATRTHTHDFIRRQITWFKAERDAQALDIEQSDLYAAALDLARRWRAATP
ncbi:MAG TPA: tRNA (adenosine(37)-N6)-dimethylallyltransferase MiaA [Chloroflexota bacterium]|nr:tRNA (adenosine(37)-N6)-dimethylallyltransferase MiaA [Chloroflexota bacterium]